MSIKNSILGTLSLLALGCQDSQLAINAERQPIFGGTVATSGQFPSVVAVLISQGARGLCSGTLVSPTVVLTAAHCIDPGLAGLASLDAVANETLVVFNTTNLNSGQGFVRGASQVVQHPLKPNFQNNAGLGQHDIGVIILDAPVNNLVPSPVELDPNRNLINTAVIQVGFGVDEGGNVGPLRFVNNTVDSCNNFGLNNNQLVCIDQTDGRGSCQGDSGGPLLGPNGEILGVTSFGDQNCAIFGAYTRNSFEADFVAQFLDGGNPPDCTANGQCNPVCVAVQDPDCEDCGADGVCNNACGAGGNPEDADCDDPCSQDGVCNQNCIALNRTDLDCNANNEEGEGCAVTPAQPNNTSPIVPVAALFALFGLSLLVTRRRS